MVRGFISLCLVAGAAMSGCASNRPPASAGMVAPMATLELGAGDALGQDLYTTAVLLAAEREFQLRLIAVAAAE